MNDVIEHKHCIYCGHHNAADAVQCMRCQAYLPDESDTLAAVHFSPRPDKALGAAVWCVAAGATSPLIINLIEGAQCVLGLKNQQMIESIADLTPFQGQHYGVSRRHARLIREDGLLKIEDLGSRNGTYINGIWLFPHVAHPLQDGDIIRLGGLWLRLYYDRL